MPGANPILLVPGFMGSRLSRVRDNRLIWVDPLWAAGNLSAVIRDLRLARPDDPKLYPSGVLHDVEIGNFLRVGVYRRLHEFALSRHGLGLEPRDYGEFAFDWRKSIEGAAQELDDTLVGFAAPGRPVTLIAHSQGGLVVAKLFSMGGPGAARVGKLVAVGCPFAGLLKTIDMIERGSTILDLLFPGDPIRDLLSAMPGAYELMPSRTAPALFSDAAGVPSTPFQVAGGMPASRYDPALLAAAEPVVSGLSLDFPVPVRLVDGYGKTTAVAGRLAAGGVAVQDGIEGDGTCPSASLLAATGTAAGGELGRRVFSVPFGPHVELVRDPAFLGFLKGDLLPGQAIGDQVTAEVKSRLGQPGGDNLLIVETRDPSGAPLGTGSPLAHLGDHGAIPLVPCPVAGEARWLGAFLHPTGVETIRVTVPGVPAAEQPAPIYLLP